MSLQNIVCMLTRWYFDPFWGQWHIQKATFASMSPYFNDKLSLFLNEVSFETSKENQLSYFQNGYFFKIVWWSHQPHNKGICKWKDKIISESFTNNNHGFSFVSFSTDQTLPITNWTLCLMPIALLKMFHKLRWNMYIRSIFTGRDCVKMHLCAICL